MCPTALLSLAPRVVEGFIFDLHSLNILRERRFPLTTTNIQLVKVLVSVCCSEILVIEKRTTTIVYHVTGENIVTIGTQTFVSLSRTRVPKRAQHHREGKGDMGRDFGVQSNAKAPSAVASEGLSPLYPKPEGAGFYGAIL